MTFEQLGVPESICRVLAKINFKSPTPIQAQSIPIALTGADLVGCAQTGTGKTAAFSIPLIVRLMANPKETALILAPTRELALQIRDVIKQLSEGVPNFRSCLVLGGSSMGQQVRELSHNPRVIVATPGRLNDHLRQRTVRLDSVKFLVLDECDRMLDMGFEKQIRNILQFVPNTRQTLLFSATFPNHIRELSKKYLRNPQWVTIKADTRVPKKIKHSVIKTTKKQRNGILLDELNARKGSVIIFVNTKHGTNRLFDYLDEYGYKVARIHGGRSQGQRNQAVLGFRSGEYRILVATDLAARGLDVPHVAHVINYDLPKDKDDYIHRIGRTARAGAEGEALCFLAQEDKSHWSRIEKTLNF